MAGAIQRVVDSHVHLWNPQRAGWYPFLSGALDVGMGDVSGMARVFDEPTFLAESKAWNVVKYVHVAAASPAVSVVETLELQAQADRTGHPDAIIGGIDPSLPIGEIEAQLDAQGAATRFRGVRPMGLIEGAVPDRDVLGLLRDRGLVLELMAHPADLPRCAEMLTGEGDLTVVLEHTGWPHSDSAEELAQWKQGMTAVAAAGDHVQCKLSGLAMPLGTMAAEAFRPWIEFALEVFGTDRCMVGSNFPVDGMRGTFDELFGTYESLTAHLDVDARDRVFAANAERVYRC